MVPGEENTVSSLATSSSSAVASVTILNVEPGAYSEPTARSTRVLSSGFAFACSMTEAKSAALYVGAEAMARMAPVSGSMTTHAPLRPASASCAACWIFELMVRVTSLPAVPMPANEFSTSVHEAKFSVPLSVSLYALSMPALPNCDDE